MRECAGTFCVPHMGDRSFPSLAEPAGANRGVSRYPDSAFSFGITSVAIRSM